MLLVSLFVAIVWCRCRLVLVAVVDVDGWLLLLAIVDVSLRVVCCRCCVLLRLLVLVDDVVCVCLSSFVGCCCLPLVV